MKFNVLTIILTLSMLFVGLQADAQKIAFVDVDQIVPEMPAYKRAKSEVEAYGKQLQKMLEGKQAEAQQYLQEMAGKEQRGELTPKDAQEAQQKLQQMQADRQKQASESDQN